MRNLTLLCPVTCLVAVPAAADPKPTANRHLAYAELLGKGGAFGVGYELQLRREWSTGVAVSALFPAKERLVTVSPYVAWTPFRRGRHGMFGHLGPTIVEHDIRSPVENWDGSHTWGIGGQLCGGYEYRGPVVVRGYMMVTAGRGGVTPWTGVTLGVGF